MNKKIKVIRIDKNAFYYDMLEGGIKTTNHIKEAKDVTELPFNVLTWIMKGLTEKGYKAEVIEYLKK